MAEFRREHQPSQHGFPQASKFHQPDLEELMLTGRSAAARAG